MMSTWLAGIQNSVFIINVLLIVELLFGMRITDSGRFHRISKLALVFGLSLVLYVGAAYLIPNEHIQFLFIILLMICGSIFLSGRGVSIGQRLLYILMLIPAVLLDTEFGTVMRLVDRLTGLDRISVNIAGQLYGLLYTLSDVLLLIILLILRIIVNRKGIVIRLNVPETIIIIFFCVFLPVMEMIMETILSEDGRYTVALGWVVFITILNAAVFYGVLHRSIARMYKREVDNAENQLESAIQGIDERSKRRETDLAISHDMKNHFLVVNELIQSGEYDQACEYMNILGETGYQANIPPTGCRIVDILLSAKESEMRELSITFQCIGQLQLFHQMKDVDVSILFSNMLDNAIEACAETTADRYVKIQETAFGDHTMIVMSNPYINELKWNGGNLLSSKQDAHISRSRGIGTKNIRRIAEKYGLQCSFEADAREFRVKLMR